MSRFVVPGVWGKEGYFPSNKKGITYEIQKGTWGTGDRAVLELLYDKHGTSDELKISKIRITVNTYFGNCYQADMTPNSKGELTPLDGDIRISKQYKDGTIVSHRKKHFEKMKENARYILKSSEFRNKFNEHYVKEKIKKEDFTDNMKRICF